MDKHEIIRTMELALREALSRVEPDAALEWKGMFGGAGFFVDGRIFAAWFGEGLALKLPEDAREELLEIDGAAPTQSAQYVAVPDAFLDTPDLLEPWVARSVGYARSQTNRQRKKR